MTVRRKRIQAFSCEFHSSSVSFSLSFWCVSSCGAVLRQGRQLSKKRNNATAAQLLSHAQATRGRPGYFFTFSPRSYDYYFFLQIFGFIWRPSEPPSGILSARRAGNVLTRCHFLVSGAGDLSAGRLWAAGFFVFDVNPTRADADGWGPKVLDLFFSHWLRRGKEK